MAETLSRDDLLRVMGAQAAPEQQAQSQSQVYAPTEYYQATGAVPVGEPPVPTEVAPEPKRQVWPLRGPEDMGRVLRGIEQTESGGRDQVTGPERTLAGEKLTERAEGPMQIMPSTASALGARGEEWKTGDANRQLGATYFNKLYAKYGNYEDAIQAYYAGEKKFDAWAAKGKPKGELARQVYDYMDKVLGAASLDNPAKRLLAAKGTLNRRDLYDLMSTPTPEAERPPEAEAAASSYEEDEDLAGAESVRAFGLAAYRGMLDIPVGLARVAGIEPGALKKHIDRLDTEIGALSEKGHGWAATAGDIVGQTVTIMRGAGLIAKVTARTLPELVQLASRVPALIKGGAGGGLVSITPGAQEDKGSLAARFALGALGGTIGTAIGKSLVVSANRLIDEATRLDIVDRIRKSVGVAGRNATELRDTVVAHVQNVERKLDQLYSLRDASGASVRGFSAKELGDAVDQAIANKPELRALAKDVKTKLGVVEEEARRAASEKETEKYNAAMGKWQKLIEAKVGKYAGPTLLQQWEAKLAAQGHPRPKAPPPYRPEPVRAASFSWAMRHLSTRGPEAQVVRKALEKEAGAQAAAIRGIAPSGKFTSGKPLADFLRNMEKADTFYSGSVAPFRELFARRFHTAQPSPAQFYDWITGVVEHGDSQAIAGMQRLLHMPQAQDAMQNVVLHKMLMAAGPNGEARTLRAFGEKIGQYFNKHQSALAQVLDREHFATVQGLQKVAQRLLEHPEPKKHGTWFGYKGFLWIVGLEHAFRGDFIRGAMVVGSGVAAHALFHALHTIAMDRTITPAVRRIARMRPGAEMDGAINRLLLRYQSTYAAVGRVAGQGGPPSPPTAVTFPQFEERQQ